LQDVASLLNGDGGKGSLRRTAKKIT